MPAARDEALAIAARSVIARAPWVTPGAFSSAADGAECVPVEVDGRCVGAILVRGSEIHACIDPAGHGRWCGKPALRLLARVIAEHGRATTRVLATATAGLHFVARMGFKPVGRDGDALIFERT